MVGFAQLDTSQEWPEAPSHTFVDGSFGFLLAESNGGTGMVDEYLFHMSWCGRLMSRGFMDS